MAHPRTYWKYEQFLLPRPNEQTAETKAPEPSRRFQCFEQKALGWDDKSALWGDGPSMLRTHQADLAQAGLDLSDEASGLQKVAAQLASILLPTAEMPSGQKQGCVSY